MIGKTEWKYGTTDVFLAPNKLLSQQTSMLKKMDQIQVNNALEAPTLKCDFFNGVYMLIGSSKKI